jgi:hypothetical protein
MLANRDETSCGCAALTSKPALGDLDGEPVAELAGVVECRHSGRIAAFGVGSAHERECGDVGVWRLTCEVPGVFDVEGVAKRGPAIGGFVVEVVTVVEQVA